MGGGFKEISVDSHTYERESNRYEHVSEQYCRESNIAINRGLFKMTKRSRKTAFGKANVVRRPSLKTIPVLAIDPLSLDRSALRKNARTTLLLGTALGAGLLTVMIVDSRPANAAVVCVPSATLASTNSTTGIWCATSQDLTVVTSGTTLLGGDGFASFGNDSGIRSQAITIIPSARRCRYIGRGRHRHRRLCRPVSANGIESIYAIIFYDWSRHNQYQQRSERPNRHAGTPVGGKGIYGYAYVHPL